MGINEKADHRPDRRIVNTRQRLEALERGVGLAWGDRDPADRFAVAVGQHADWYFLLGERIERCYPFLFCGALVVGARQPPAHARAIAELAVRLGEARQIIQALWYDGMVLIHNAPPATSIVPQHILWIPPQRRLDSAVNHGEARPYIAIHIGRG